MSNLDIEKGGEAPRRRSSIRPADLPVDTLVTEDDVFRRMSVAVPNLVELSNEAKAATEKEVNMTLAQGLKLYPAAIGWSMLLSLAIVMEGYDVVLLGNFYGFPAFQQRYGDLLPDGTYQLSAAWQSGLSNGAQVGEILGLFLNGIISESIGYRKTMIGALTLVICFIFLSFFAQNVQMLLAAEILCGIPWGVFQTLTTTYAAEVCPVALRAYLTTYVNLCWVMGQVVGSGVLRGMLEVSGQWAYRVPFAIQWIWPVPIIIGVFFAPESPWWLVRKGRTEDAKKVILRLTTRGADPNFNADETVAMMVHTNELERQITSGTGYIDCFRGVDLRRTEICSVVWAIQTFCGSPLMGYSTYFLEQAGLATDLAFDMSLAGYAIGFFGTVCSWGMMNFFGRRTLYLAGEVVMIVILLIVGGIATRPKIFSATIGNDVETPNDAWVTGGMLLAFTFVYDITVGPVCYSLVAELPSDRLRIKTVVIARNVYNLAGILVNILMPRMLNPSSWNWQGLTGFFWAGMCLLCLIWTYFRLPEPKGLTYGELDVLFENKISARNFRKVNVDPFRSATMVINNEGYSPDENDNKDNKFDKGFQN